MPATTFDIGISTRSASEGTFIASKSFTAGGGTWGGQYTGGTNGDDVEIKPPCRAIRCNGAGNLHVTYASGVTDTIPVAAGETVLGQFAKLFADSTITAPTLLY